MSRNNLSFILGSLAAGCSPVGGQAVMEGVMMRNGDAYGLAVRKADGVIIAQRLPWKALTRSEWLKLPFVRGFPVLLETLINGIQALNRSVVLCSGEEDDTSGGWPVILTLVVAIVMAMALFVVLPHFLSWFMHSLNWGADVAGVSFHLWDGFFKCAVFVAYLKLISFVPDIRRVFEYHGAEHKTIHAFESGQQVNSCDACRMSRLHPRCGTTFLLFVICISIILQVILIPLFISGLNLRGAWAIHIGSLLFKLFLIIPISAVSYEIIRFAARLPKGFPAAVLQAPGLALQKLTTCEPSRAQLEVAVVALSEAMGAASEGNIVTVPYVRLSSRYCVAHEHDSSFLE